MQVRNKTNRFDLAIEAFETMIRRGVLNKEKGTKLAQKCRQKLVEHGKFIRIHGINPNEIEQWQ